MLKKLSFLALAGCIAGYLPAQDKVELIATGAFPGNAKDLSGLVGQLEENTPLDQLGGFSAIEYSGQANRFYVLADRGPADGATEFRCRMHTVDVDFASGRKELKLDLVATTMMKHSNGESLVGSLAVLKDPARSVLAFDPEGIRKLSNGDFLISEEYGPRICRFSANGTFQSQYELPKWMNLAQGASAVEWLRGTVPNRGLEAVAISPEGDRIVAMMQGPLAQDSRQDNTKRIGLFTRIVVIDRKGNDPSTKQFVYPLQDMTTGISEVLAISRDQYLVLERDSESGAAAKIKKIFKIDLSDATDVSSMESIGIDQLPQGVVPVVKSDFLDLMDVKFGYSGEQTPEKPEGLAWGQNLDDGRKSLIVCFDNDFEAIRESLFMVFAVSGDDVKVSQRNDSRK